MTSLHRQHSLAGEQHAFETKVRDSPTQIHEAACPTVRPGSAYTGARALYRLCDHLLSHVQEPAKFDQRLLRFAQAIGFPMENEIRRLRDVK